MVYETDLLVLIDRTALILEAKSHHLTERGLRGGPENLERHIKDLVLEPSQQSQRLKSLIELAGKGDMEALQAIASLNIDSSNIDNIIRVSITLDDFSVLAAAEYDMKEVGWVPSDHELAPSIHLADFNCITDILGGGVLLLHYLNERGYLQKELNILGDELDLLGLYLVTGFNLNIQADENTQFTPSGMSGPIDRYYTALDEGIETPKPMPDLEPLFLAIIKRLEERKPNGWTTIGLSLIGSCSFEEQQTAERKIEQLRRIVEQGSHNLDSPSVLVLRPTKDRWATLMFYVYSSKEATKIRENMERIAAEALADPTYKKCVVFARDIENWESPYSHVLYVSNKPA